MKYYAVRKGRRTGVFYNWNDCSDSIKGYSGAEYKSFPTEREALEFLNNATSDYVDFNFSEEEVEKMISNKEEVVCFVDGSYDDTKKRYSFGLVALGLGVVHEDYCDDFEPGKISSRNVAGEITGSMTAMDYCLENGVKKLHLFYDYEGIAKWALGDWKAKTNISKEYKEYYDSIKEKLSVEFHKVPAHVGIKYNERADQLAKKALGLI